MLHSNVEPLYYCRSWNLLVIHTFLKIDLVWHILKFLSSGLRFAYLELTKPCLSIIANTKILQKLTRLQYVYIISLLFSVKIVVDS